MIEARSAEQMTSAQKFPWVARRCMARFDQLLYVNRRGTVLGTHESAIVVAPADGHLRLWFAHHKRCDTHAPHSECSCGRRADAGKLLT